MPTKAFPETDPEEIRHSQFILLKLKRVENLSAELEKYVDASSGSCLANDDARTPHHTVSSYAYAQILAALGCLEALGRMAIRETDNTINLTLSPYGAYALIRNALDAAGTALWLLEPCSSTLRVKRRILLGVDEVKNSASFRQSMGRPGWTEWKKNRRARFREISSSASLPAGWNPLKAEMPSMTYILAGLERHHQKAVMAWLPAWQLASGHAHAKVWAQLASHQLDEIADTRTDTGATFEVSIKYGMLAVLMHEAVQLIEVAGVRYMDLARESHAPAKRRLKLIDLSFAKNLCGQR